MMTRQLHALAKIGRHVGGLRGSRVPPMGAPPLTSNVPKLGAKRNVSMNTSRFFEPIVTCTVSRPIPMSGASFRSFHSEAEYHNVADESLEDIQDCIEETLEEAGLDCEINYASGVLTMSLPPHGTFVINKQTPNQQIWWSSPISGPRRYEYNKETGKWVFSRDGDITLGETLKEEFQQMYDLELDVDV